MGFSLNQAKTRILRPGKRQIVTGVVVNAHPQAPREYRRRLRQELFFAQKYGVKAHLAYTRNIDLNQIENADTARYINALLGRIGFVLQINPADAFFSEAREHVLSMRTM